MVTPLWEWVMPRESGGACVGVSMTRDGAMEALSRALINDGSPGGSPAVSVIGHRC